MTVESINTNSEIDFLKSEILNIKKNMIEKDDILTFEEFQTLQESIDSQENNISIDELKEQLGLN